jgi:hypothetical protein
VVLQLLVKCTDIVCTIKNTDYTWEYLESEGILMLEPCENNFYKVIMPYMYAGQLVLCCVSSDASLGNLSWLFAHEVNTNGGIVNFYWGSFELYCCHLQVGIWDLFQQKPPWVF